MLYIDVFDGGLSIKYNANLADLPIIPELDTNLF